MEADSILDEIRRQLEFCFGDENLLKDRSLRKLIKSSRDGYVSIATIAAFARVKRLGVSNDIIIKAVRQSEVLETNFDDTMIRRMKPMITKKDHEHRIVYVENLPKNADQEWVRSLFERHCGPISRISLPKSEARSQDHKPMDFCFVEFTKDDSALKAVQLFNTSSRLSLEGVDRETIRDTRQRGFRVMAKIDWLRYKKEYKLWLQFNRQRCDEQKAGLPYRLSTAFEINHVPIETSREDLRSILSLSPRIAYLHRMTESQVILRYLIDVKPELVIRECGENLSKVSPQVSIRHMSNYEEFKFCEYLSHQGSRYAWKQEK